MFRYIPWLFIAAVSTTFLTAQQTESSGDDYVTVQEDYEKEQTGQYSRQTKDLSESRADYELQQVDEGLAKKQNYIDVYEDAKKKWRPYFAGDFALGYDSNINLSPHDGPFKPITDGTYDGYALLGIDRVVWDKLYVEAELTGAFHYYFWRHDLNYRHADLLGKFSYLWNDSVVSGVGVNGTRMYQPKLLDLEDRLLAQDFTYWGYDVNPFITWFLGDNWTFDGDFIFRRKKYHFVPGQFPYDNYEYDIGLKLAKDWRRWHILTHFDWSLIHYTDLPPFDRLGNFLATWNKRQYYNTIWGITLTKDFDYFIMSGDWVMEVRVDDFEGYENFVSNQVAAYFTYLPLKDRSMMYTLSGLYEHRDYRHRRSVSQPLKLVKYDTFNVIGEYLIEIAKHWHLHGLLEFRQRATNNNASDHDRFYKQWNFKAGINAKY